MAGDGICWISTPGVFDLGYGALFARELSPEELVHRMHGELVSAEPMTRIQAGEYEINLMDDSENRVVRIGSSGEWTFALSESGPVGDNYEEVARLASVNTECVSVSRTINAVGLFMYAENGAIVCRFEPGFERYRTGLDPDRLADAMKQVGLLLPNGKSPLEEGKDVEGNVHLNVLRMAEIQFGLDLPRELILNGRLLTVRLPAEE